MKSTSIDIINKIKLIHGDNYLLDRFKYSSYKEKVILICKTHGEFEISLSNLIGNRRGCPKCGILRSKESCRSNTEEFIIKSNKIHNNKYIYDDVDYYNWNKKVSIICREHGCFMQSPNIHLRGSGCPKCKKGRPRNPIKKIDKINNLQIKKEYFIEISKKVHNNYYDYSCVEYTASNKKVKILCRKHGEFEQTPTHHKRGNGCPSCSYENSFGPRITTADFISISKKRHHNYYSYDKSEYSGNKSKVVITCPKHGSFLQIPKYHMNGGGCPRCNIGKHGNGTGNRKLKYTTNQFIKIAKETHDDKYDYSLCEYYGIKSMIKLICKNHGLFETQAYHHINGVGCSKCSIDNKKRKKLEIINEFNKIHDNKYLYKIDSEFISTSDSVNIICKEHGGFHQNVETHLRGSGCNLCSTKSRGEIFIKNTLEKYNINFVREKSFESRLRFDFWLPELKTIIEFDGKHHFQPIDYFGGLESFEKIRKNDELKNRYCENNKINLLRINYKDLKNIENIIKKEIIENVKLQT
jgi:very-short-patch-repair endonuclease